MKLSDKMQCVNCGQVNHSVILTLENVRIQRIVKDGTVYTIFPPIQQIDTSEGVYVCHSCEGTEFKPVTSEKGNKSTSLHERIMKAAGK